MKKTKLCFFVAILIGICCMMVITFSVKEDVDYEDYLRKTWVAECWHGGNNEYTARYLFIIDSVEDGTIEGRYARYLYMDVPVQRFSGVIKHDEAECILYGSDGETVVGALQLLFLDNGKIEATIDWYANSLHKTYIFRPYNIGDIANFQLSTGVKQQTVEIETWGKVTLVAGVIQINKPYPCIYFVNEHDEILYRFEASYQTGSEVYKMLVEDFDSDGLRDVKIITYFPRALDIEKIERVFYQMENGEFDTNKYKY